MEAWFQRGRPALFEALAGACRQIDKDILAEVQRHTQSDAAQVGQVEPPRSAPVAASGPFDEAPPGRPISSAPVLAGSGDAAVKPISSSLLELSHDGPPKSSPGDSSWEAAYLAIHTKHERLKRKFVIARDALERRQTQMRACNGQISFLKRQIRVAEKKHGIQILDKGHSRDPAASNQPILTPQEGHLEDISRLISSIPAPTDPPLQSVQATTTNHHIDQTLQSTQGESEESNQDNLPPLGRNPSQEVRIKEEPKSSSPEALFERPVRKRKRGEQSTVERSPRRGRVKSEPPGSSPVPTLSRRITAPDESMGMDLGTGERLMTPRKQREVEELEAYRACRILDRLVSPTPRLRVHHDSSQGDEFAITSSDLLQRPRPQPLDPLDINTPKGRLIDYTKEAEKGLASALDDGISKEPAFRTPTGRSMLGSMPNAPFSDHFRKVDRRATTTSTSTSSSRPELPLPHRRELPFDGISDQRLVQSLPRGRLERRPQNPKESPLQQARAPKPAKLGSLRRKPVSELRREDFKINPVNNDGENFAFTEVVRDKEARSNMPGCTDMHCCGKEFRGLALSEQPDPPLTHIQRQDQHDLLERYLGDDCHRLASMSSEEKADLWVEARTQALANKYGKHRHRYARMRSPPGFWNADFPSTQELASDRAEAERRERIVVEERYREALRVCGRWKFRDE